MDAVLCALNRITLVAHVARMQRHAEVFTVARDEERQRRREASGAATIIRYGQYVGPRALVLVVRFSHGCDVCVCRGVRHWMRVKREQKRQTALRELSKPMLKHLLRWRERRRNQVGQARRQAMQSCQCIHMSCLLAVTTGCRRHSWRAAAHEPDHEGPILHQEVHQCRYNIACLCALPWCVPSLTHTGIIVPFKISAQRTASPGSPNGHHQCPSQLVVCVLEQGRLSSKWCSRGTLSNWLPLHAGGG